jgi:hypothetical protein
MNLEVMKQLIKEQQKADAMSESSSSSESSLEDDSPSVIHPQTLPTARLLANESAIIGIERAILS